MDIDTFPNAIDYWGPNGMIFVRTPQIRYTYKTGGKRHSRSPSRKAEQRRRSRRCPLA